jgi:hypothetical protein
MTFANYFTLLPGIYFMGVISILSKFCKQNYLNPLQCGVNRYMYV